MQRKTWRSEASSHACENTLQLRTFKWS